MCSGSGVWSGTEKLAECHALIPMELQSSSQSVESADLIHMGIELRRIQYLGKTQCSHSNNPLAAHFELRIEQGPLLEKTRKKVGVVEGVQGMTGRADALVVLAKFAVKVEELANNTTHLALLALCRLKQIVSIPCPGAHSAH